MRVFYLISAAWLAGCATAEEVPSVIRLPDGALVSLGPDSGTNSAGAGGSSGGVPNNGGTNPGGGAPGGAAGNATAGAASCVAAVCPSCPLGSTCCQPSGACGCKLFGLLNCQ